MANPYVYKCEHKETGQIYYGFRSNATAQLNDSLEDLKKYKTSSKIVRPIFDEFNISIIREFEGEEASKLAYALEQDLIKTQWETSKELSLNGHYDRSGEHKWNNAGKSRTEETKSKIALGRTGKTHTEETKKKCSMAKIGVPSAFKGKTHSYESNEKNRLAHLGKNPFSEEQIAQMRIDRAGEGNAMFGKTHSHETRNKISERALSRPKKQCPHCDAIMTPGNLSQHINRKHKG